MIIPIPVYDNMALTPQMADEAKGLRGRRRIRRPSEPLKKLREQSGERGG